LGKQNKGEFRVVKAEFCSVSKANSEGVKAAKVSRERPGCCELSAVSFGIVQVRVVDSLK
jgi:hypothetical protein